MSIQKIIFVTLNNQPMIEVFEVTQKDGIYTVEAIRTINDKDYEGTHTISNAMLDWFIENRLIEKPVDAFNYYSISQLCERYLKWYYFEAKQVRVMLDKPYELIYTVKDANCLCWLLVDRDLNIKEPHTIALADQHKVRYEAHYKEANRNQPFNF